MLLHWFLCFWGNLAGSLFTMAIIFGCKAPSRAPNKVQLMSHFRRRPADKIFPLE